MNQYHRIGQNAQLLFLVVFTLTGLRLSGATLEPAVDKATGRNVYSDFWGAAPVREINPRDRVTLLGTTLGLGEHGTSVDVRLILAIISDDTNDVPRDFKGSISAQVRSSTNELDSRNLLGQLQASVLLHPDAQARSPVRALRHAKDLLADDQALFVYEVAFSIPLKRKLNVIPEYISVYSGMYNELNIWNFTRFSVEGKQDEPSQASKGVAAPTRPRGGQTRSDNSRGRPKAVPTGSSTVGQSQRHVPQVKLSIHRERDFLLIRCLPEWEGAVLEEGSLSLSPLEWRPVQLGTNSGSAWYVPPADGARVFRLRIPGNER